MLATCCMFASAQEKPSEAPVSKAFLEYLAELVEVDGKLVHPTELEANPASKSATTNSDNNPKSKKIVPSSPEKVNSKREDKP